MSKQDKSPSPKLPIDYDFMRGVITVTGPHNTGKTTAGLQLARADRIIMFDGDVKSQRYESYLLQYHNLNAIREGRNELQFALEVERIFEEMPESDVVIIDPVTTLEQSQIGIVSKSPSDYRTSYSKHEQIRKGELFREARERFARKMAMLLEKTKVVYLTAHLKKEYISGKNGAFVHTGRSIPALSPELDRISSLRMYLRRGIDGAGYFLPIPNVFFLKREVAATLNDNGVIVPVNFLPRRVVPNVEDTSIWDGIIRYYNNPIGNRQPTPDEEVSPEELRDLIGGYNPQLLRELIEITRLSGGLVEDDEPSSVDDAEIIERLEAGQSPAEISKALNVPVGQVVKIKSQL